MSQSPFVPFYTSDFLAGTGGMTAATKGVYITLLCLIYEREAPLPQAWDDLARRCGCTLPAFNRAVERLEADGKIAVLDEGIWSEKCEKHIAQRCERRTSAKAAAKTRWQKSQQKQRQDDAGALRRQCKPEPEPYYTLDKQECSARAKGNDDAERKSGGDEAPDHEAGTAKQKTGIGKRAIGECAEPTEKDIQHAEQHGIDWRAEWPKFRDYHIRAETRTTDRGWRASWRSWCRKAVEFAERARSNDAPRQNGGRMDWNEAAALVMAEQANTAAVVDDGGWPDWLTGDAPMPGATAPRLSPGSDGGA